MAFGHFTDFGGNENLYLLIYFEILESLLMGINNLYLVNRHKTSPLMFAYLQIGHIRCCLILRFEHQQDQQQKVIVVLLSTLLLLLFIPLLLLL